MNRVLFHKGKALPVMLFAVLCCSCVKQFSPDQAMSSPKIVGQTKVRELLGARDQSPRTPQGGIELNQARLGLNPRQARTEEVILFRTHNIGYE